MSAISAHLRRHIIRAVNPSEDPVVREYFIGIKLLVRLNRKSVLRGLADNQTMITIQDTAIDALQTIPILRKAYCRVDSALIWLIIHSEDGEAVLQQRAIAFIKEMAANDRQLTCYWPLFIRFTNTVEMIRLNAISLAIYWYEDNHFNGPNSQMMAVLMAINRWSYMEKKYDIFVNLFDNFGQRNGIEITKSIHMSGVYQYGRADLIGRQQNFVISDLISAAFISDSIYFTIEMIDRFIPGIFRYNDLDIRGMEDMAAIEIAYRSVITDKMMSFSLFTDIAVKFIEFLRVIGFGPEFPIKKLKEVDEQFNIYWDKCQQLLVKERDVNGVKHCFVLQCLIPLLLIETQ